MKENPKEVKIQWHAYFAQVMERICTKKDFLVEREKEVAKMPLKIDFIVIKKQDVEYKNLTEPYSYFNDINVIEFKSKTDNFDWQDLYQLQVYGQLYGINKEIEKRKKISLWAVSSHFTEKYRNSLEEGSIVLERVDDGFFRGIAGGFPYYEMDLNELPFRKEYYPFHLFSKNEGNVRKLVEKFIEEPDVAEDYNIEIIFLYNKMYREVLLMKLIDPFEAGCDEEGLKELLFGEPIGVKLINKYKTELINKLGEEEIIKSLGEDKITKALLNRLGKKKLLELLDRLDGD